MTAMDTQQVAAPSTHQGPPPIPPPPPGCAGSLQLPHWRSEPLPIHLAPTKEEIDKEQFAHLPDKLMNTMNKDKKPFTYTPSGVSGNEKGKLDLSSIRSPKMRKRLLANLVDDEDSDQFESERVTRSETPDPSSKQRSVQNNRRAMTPDMSSMNHQMFAPVLPPIDLRNGRESPLLQKQMKNSLPNNEFESFIQKQMKEMETTLKNQKNSNEYNDKVNGLEPEVQELIDSYANHRSVPTKVESTLSEPEFVTHYTEPESTKPAELPVPQRLENIENTINDRQESNGKNGIIYSRSSDRNDSKRDNNYKTFNNNKNTSNPWESDLLKHVLDGGLQEEIEKFEKISLETQQSFTPKPKRTSNQPNLETYYETPTFDTFGRTLPNPAPVWSPPPNQFQDNPSNHSNPMAYGSLNRNTIRNDIRSPQPFQSARQYWSESPSPSPHPYFDRESASAEPPVYRGVNIPSNHNMKQRTGISSSEVPNYNCRPKPFYLCSPPPTPTATPPPQFGHQQQQAVQRPKEQHFTTFGKNISPQKINYQKEISNIGIESSPQTRYIENIGMYSQTRDVDEWEGSNPNPSHIARSLDRNITFSDRLITSPERTGFKSPEPPKPILKKKLPPSERPPDPTPSKYMGANIPSRSFRFLQLMTGEDIDNQYITDNQNNGFETKSKPKSSFENCKQFNKTIGYSNYEDFGTDF